MSGGISKLNAAQCAAAVRAGTKARLWDGGGLFLQILGPGRASWRYKYRLGGKEKLLAIGTHADVSLAEARAVHTEARKQVAGGIDPVVRRRLQRAEEIASSGIDFQTVAREWLGKIGPGWSERHRAKSERALERDVYPSLGRLPVAAITAAMVAKALDGVDQRAPETGRRIRQHVALIFDFARVRGYRETNPVVRSPGMSRSTGTAKAKQPAITNLADLGAVLRAAEVSTLSPAVRLASWVLAHTAVRPGELVAAEWCEFDLDSPDPRWTIPRERMKAKGKGTDHAIPLAPAVVSRLKEWRLLSGRGRYVFASAASKHGRITVESLEKAYRVTLGLRDKHVPHGWRSAFSTNAHDALDAKGGRLWDADVIEVALDHELPGGKVRAAYDRGERWQARRQLMNWWADRLHAAVHGADVVDIRRHA